jgi:hypothetical protein
MTKTELIPVYKRYGFIIESIKSFLLKRKNSNGYKQQAPMLKQLSDTLKSNRQLKDIAAVKILNENLLTVEDAGYLFIVYLTTNSFSIFRRKTNNADFYVNEYFNFLRQNNYVIKERSFTGELKKIYVQSRNNNRICATKDGLINTIYIKKGTVYYRLEKSIII